MNRWISITAAGAGLLLGLTLPGSARAADRDGLFSPVVQASGQELVLHGQGVLKYKRIIPVYDAALYLPPGTEAKQALGRVARRLQVVYRRGGEARRFADAGNKVLTRTLSSEVLRSLQERLDRINALYPDPTNGDRCTLTYIPGRGTSLSFNGKRLGSIEGDDFAEAYFSIWLGDDPASPSLRDDLLDKETVR